MKKGSETAKGAAVKSGALKKTALASAGLIQSAVTPGLGQEEAELPPVIIFPEWNDAEINAEKWSTKHAFEDPDFVLLPRSLRGFVDSYKRHLDLMQLAGDTSPGVGVASAGMVDDAFAAVGLPTNGGVAATTHPNTGLLGANLTAQQSTTRKYSAAGIDEVEPSSDSVGSDPAVTIMDSEHSAAEHSNPVIPQDTLVSGIDGAASPAVMQSSMALDEDFNTIATGLQTSEQDTMSQTSKFFQHNRHLITASDLMRQIIATFHFMYDQSKLFRGQNMAVDEKEFTPWDNIYPKGKDGLPMYNPSGRYAVKVFWLGCWRKVIVDDRVPMDDQNRPLIPCSPVIQEIWPILVSKALLKVAAASYRELSALSVAAGGPIGATGTNVHSQLGGHANPHSATFFPRRSGSTGFEQGDFDVFHTLRGWIPERIGIDEREARVNGIWSVLTDLNFKGVQSFAGLMPKNAVWGAPAPPAAAATAASLAPKNAGGLTAAASPMISVLSPGVSNEKTYLIGMAYREGDDTLDIATIGYPFRICETRESQDVNSNTQRQIVLKSYFALKKKAANHGKAHDEPDEGNEFTIPYSDFIKSHRYLILYHNPASFKSLRSIQNIIDPAKPVDLTRIPPVIYLQDVSKEANLLVSLSTYGRSKQSGQNQASSVLIEKYDWKFDPQRPDADRKFVMRLATNSTLASLVKLPPGITAYKFTVDCANSYSISFWSRDEYCMEDEAKYLTERLNLSVRDVDESFPAQQAGSWFTFFKNQLRFSEPTYLAGSLFVPESLQNAACLRMFDNDTGKELPHVFYCFKSRKFLPNKNGYTLLADCKTQVARPSAKWKLRLVSEPSPIFPADKPIPDLSVKPIVQDFEDTYVQNKHNILFRFVLRVKDAPENYASLQLTFSVPNAELKMQVFDNDVEIASGFGKGIVTLHAVNLLQVAEDAAPMQPAAVSAAKGEKKEKDKEKEEKERLAKEAAMSTVEKPPIAKHRYVLQATVYQLENMKPNSTGLSAPNTADAKGASTRSNSKSVTPASATTKSKKKSAGASSPAPGTVVIDPVAPSSAVDLAWKLRIISTDTASLIVVKDTEKEDRYKMIKDSWEASQQGRAARAREAREAYLKQVEAGSIKPIAFMLTPKVNDDAPVVQIGKPKEVQVVAKGDDVVYKPWVILKETPQGGRRLDSYDKVPMIFGSNGERVIYDGSRAVSTPSDESRPSTRGLSAFEESSNDGGSNINLSKPQTAGSELKLSTGTRPRPASGRKSSSIAQRQSSIIVGPNANTHRTSSVAIAELVTLSTLDNVAEADDPVAPAEQGKQAALPSKPTAVKFSVEAKDENPDVATDDEGECPSTLSELQSFLKGKSTYTRRNTLFHMGEKLVRQKPSPGDLFEIRTPAIVLPGGQSKVVDMVNLTRRRSSTYSLSDINSNRASFDAGAAQLRNSVHRASIISEKESEVSEVGELEEEGDRTSAQVYSRRTSLISRPWAPNQPRGRVLTAADMEERARRRQERMLGHTKFHEEVLKSRIADKEYRFRVKQYIAEKLEEAWQEIEPEKAEDFLQREIYRARVAKEYEDASNRKLALEMQRAAELAALEGAAEELANATIAAGKKKGKNMNAHRMSVILQELFPWVHLRDLTSLGQLSRGFNGHLSLRSFVSKAVSLSTLPAELVSHIALRHLHHANTLTLMRVSRRLRAVLGNSQVVWASMTLEKTGIAYLEDGGDWRHAYFDNGLLEACPHLSRLVTVTKGYSTSDARTGLKEAIEKLYLEQNFETVRCSEVGCEVEGSANVWMCLAKGCYRVGCGRSFNGHGLSHHEAEGDHHALCVRLNCFEVWCYECEEWLGTPDAPVAERHVVKRLQECLLEGALAAVPAAGDTMRAFMALNDRRNEERKSVQMTEHGRSFFVSRNFLNPWHEFLNFRGPEPGPIDNRDLVETDADGRLWVRANQFPGWHFRIFSEEGWNILQKHYPGSGPAVSEDNIPVDNVDMWDLVVSAKERIAENKGRVLLACKMRAQKNTMPDRERPAAAAVTKPKALARGSRVGVVCLSNGIAALPSATALRGFERLAQLFGFEVVEAPNLRSTGDGLSAGSAQTRADSLLRFFGDESIDGIVAFWGGLHGHQILDLLDYDLIKRHPKVFIGYSDTTSALLAIHAKTGLVTFNGPAVITFAKPDVPQYTTFNFEATLFASTNALPEPFPVAVEFSENPFFLENDVMKWRANPGPAVILHGKATGPTVPANLDTLMKLAGTPFWPDMRGRVLFLEEEDSSPSDLESKLAHLGLMGVWGHVVGLVLGRFQVKSGFQDTMVLADVVKRALAKYDVDIPVITGIDWGHTEPCLVIPVGIQCALSTDPLSIQLLESAVI
ncbi:LD-carboxypeptidase-domain-containing protein [Chytriomyces sp. MP71]|nr:LD-carboxypeptidase-domain-containing protein [Chytriomyces sp. MP71]